MTILKFIGFALLALVAVFAVLAAIAPRHYTIQLSTKVAAPRSEVFKQVSYLANYPSWSPWKETDPEQQTRVEGTDGQPGVKFHWSGKEGAGYQTIQRMKEDQYVDLQCFISEPFKSEPTFNYKFTDTPDGGTEIVQTFNTDMPVPTNVIGMLMGLKKNIEKVNARGLERLKIHSEKVAVSTSAQ